MTRTTASGEVRYQAHVRRKGHPARVASFNSRTRAKAWIQRTEAAIQEGRLLPQREAQRTSLGDIVDRYEADESYLNLSAGEQRKRSDQLAAWVDVLGDVPLADLTPNRIDEARARLREGRSPTTVNRYLSALSVVLSFAVGKGLLPANPARGGRHGALRRAKEKRRERVLTPEERGRLLAACSEADARLHALVVLALTTGGRQGELLGLRWSEV
ncbi:MAG: site-specific integrase, partial [Thermoanaerobaculia bacterium]|nr:site-specific integrase [Thermoanaerobaculia bacterium]